MNSKKLLWVEAVFNLPDDFQGTWREAIMLYAEYIRDVKINKNIINKEMEVTSLNLTQENMGSVLLDNKKIKHASKVIVQEFIDNEWIDITDLGDNNE